MLLIAQVTRYRRWISASVVQLEGSRVPGGHPPTTGPNSYCHDTGVLRFGQEGGIGRSSYSDQYRSPALVNGRQSKRWSWTTYPLDEKSSNGARAGSGLLFATFVEGLLQLLSFLYELLIAILELDQLLIRFILGPHQLVVCFID